MGLRPGYQQTEVGVIPEGWKTPPIMDITCKIMDYRGRTPRKLGMDWGGGNIPALSARNVKMGFIDLAEECYFGSEALYRRWMTSGDTEKDDIVVTMEAPLGNVALIPDDRKYILSQRTVLLRADPGLAFSPFLFQLMLSGRFQGLLAENSTGTTAKGIQRRKFEKLKIACPPLPEQRAIAGVLRDVDAVLNALDQLIAKKRNLKQAAMQQLVAGHTRLPGFSGEWGKRKLGSVLRYEQPTRYLVHSAEYDDHNEVAVLTANKSFVLGYTDELDGVCDTVPVIIFDDFTTATKYVDFPFKVKSSALKILRARDTADDLRFLFLRMQIVPFSLGDHKRYWISEYQHLEVGVPSPPEQSAIAEVISDMDAEIGALEQRLAKTHALKQGMMQELLTGRTRLV